MTGPKTRKFVLLACLLLGLGGCDRLKEAFDSIVAQASSESPLGVSNKVEVVPANADQVARFADEAELEGEEPVRLSAPVTNVAEEPGAKRALVVLPRQHEVTKIAQRGNAFLVVFKNPQNKDEMLMGWVQKSAFETQAEEPIQQSSVKCGFGLDKLAGNPEFCARVCSFDDGCEGTEKCTGIGQISEAGQPGRNVKFCVPKLEQKKEFVKKQAKTTIKVTPPPKPTAIPLSERCSPTCTATCDCAGRLRKCSPTCTATCDCRGRPIVKAEARCSPTCTATCDCAGRPRKCSPTCTSTCDCSGNPIVKAEAKCSPTCTATCDCAGRPRKCSPTCTSTCDCSGNPIVKVEAKCSPTCTATCDCAGRPRKCSPTCTSTCDCSGNPIATPPPTPTNKITAPKVEPKSDEKKKKKKKKKKKADKSEKNDK